MKDGGSGLITDLRGFAREVHQLAYAPVHPEWQLLKLAGRMNECARAHERVSFEAPITKHA